MISIIQEGGVKTHTGVSHVDLCIRNLSMNSKKYHELSLKHKYTENSGMSNLIHVCKNLTSEQHLYSN